MGKNAGLILGLTGGLVAMLATLAVFYKRQIDLAMQYCYKISNFKPIKVSSNLVSFDLYLLFQNKSSLEVTLNTYDLSVFINDKKVSKITTGKTQVLKNNGISEISFNVQFNPMDFWSFDYVITLVKNILYDKSKVNFRILGTIDASVNFVRLKDFPLDITMNLQTILSPPDPNAVPNVCNI